MKQGRTRLVSGTYLNGRYQIIAHLPEEDTESTLVYLAIEQSSCFADVLLLLVEYCPVQLCERTNTGELHVASGFKQSFENGLNDFREETQRLCTEETDPQLGVLVDHKESNQTTYRIHRWKDYVYRKMLKEVSGYANIPAGYFPDDIDGHNFKFENIDLDKPPYARVLKDVLQEQGIQSLTELTAEAQQMSLYDFASALSHEREALMDMMMQLQAFEQGESDYAMGEKRRQITLDEMDENTGQSNWYRLRMLIKPDDEFWRWVIPGESAGVCMYRNGRVFRNWVTQIS